MRNCFLFLLLLFSVPVFGQDIAMYTAARAGLNLREQPDPASKVLTKVPYATAVKMASSDSGKKIITEGFTGYWRKVTYNNQTGYVIDSYLLPVAPPPAGIKNMKDYLKILAKAHGDSLVIDNGSEEVHARMIKQLFANGAEWHEFQRYEYNSMTYFLPSFTIQQAFLLIRLLPEFEDYVGEKDEFVTVAKTVKKKNREYQYTVEKEVFGDTPWINRIKIGFEEGAIYNFELFQIDNQVVIFYGAGV